MFLLLTACLRAPPGPFVLTTPEAEVGVTVEGALQAAHVPMRVSPGATVLVDKAPIPGLAPGEVAYVDVDEAGNAEVHVYEIGLDLDPDQLAVAGDHPRVDELAAEVGAEVAELGRGWSLLRGLDLWEIDWEGWEDLDGVAPVAWDGGTTVEQRAAGLVRAPGWSAGRGLSGVVDSLRGDDPIGAERTLTDAMEQAAAAAAQAAAVEREAQRLAWVGVYAGGRDCLLLDLTGGYRTCELGLDQLAGRWTAGVDGLELDGEVVPHDPEAATIDLGGDEPLVRAGGAP